MIELILKIQILLRLERAPVAYQQQKIIRLHSHDLLRSHKLLALLRVGEITALVR